MNTVGKTAIQQEPCFSNGNRESVCLYGVAVWRSALTSCRCWARACAAKQLLTFMMRSRTKAKSAHVSDTGHADRPQFVE